MKAFFLVVFAAAALTAFGAQALLDPEEEGRSGRAARRLRLLFGVAAGLGLAGFVFVLWDRWVCWTDGWIRAAAVQDAAEAPHYIPYMKDQILRAAALFAALAGGVFLLFRLGARRSLLALALGAFLLFDLFPVARRALATAPVSFYAPDLVPAVIAGDRGRFRICHMPQHLRELTGGRMAQVPRGVYDPARPVVSPEKFREWNRKILASNYGILFGLEYADGYESANLIWHNRFLAAVHAAPLADWPRLLGLTNVKYMFADERAAGPDLLPRQALDCGIVLFENRRALPRAYFAGRAMVEPDDEAACLRILDPAFDPSREVVLVGRGWAGALGGRPLPPAALPAGPAPPVAIKTYGNSRIELAVDAPGPGFVVLADSYYPAWTAAVNGAPAPVFRANLTVMAVPVGPGPTRLELAFDAGGFKRAARVSLAALAACLLLAGADFWRRRRRRMREGATGVGIGPIGHTGPMG